MNNKYHVSNQRMYNTTTLHRTVTVDGLSISYREAGDQSNPKLVLLHGFPSSHQYHNLILALADHFHVVAPDYPGFGNSDIPNPNEHTFNRLSEIMEALVYHVHQHDGTAAVSSCESSFPAPSMATRT